MISSEEYEKSTRGTEEVSDTTDVDVNVETDGWAGAIDAGFDFGGEEKEGGAE